MSGEARRAMILSLALLVAGIAASGQALDPRLKILEPMTGKLWSGELSAPGGGSAWATRQEYEAVLDGAAVKFSASTPAIGSFTEGYFYWDREQGKIAVFMIDNKGIYYKGFASEEDGRIVVAGQISFPERKFEYKNSFEFTPDGGMIDRWSQNAFGAWRPGHVVEYRASAETASPR